MKTIIFCICLCLPTFSYADKVIGTVSIIAPTSQNASMVSSRGYTEFQVVGQPAGCLWFFITPQDNNVLATLLSADAQQRYVEVTYNPSKFAPWTNSSCAAELVFLLP